MPEPPQDPSSPLSDPVVLDAAVEPTGSKRWLSVTWPRLLDWTWLKARWAKWRSYIVEWLIIIAVGFTYSSDTLLDFNANQLQQSGEHNESAALPLLAEIGLTRYGEIPLWNPYMLTGFPHAGDLISHFWSPVATLPVLVWGGINGMKVSVFLAFVLAGIGQWLFAHVFGARGLVRLWAGLLFMLSGGLALLWRVGWYELLLGMAWFPWCFASLWWALGRRDRASLACTALCVVMVLTTGGGYYPIYLLVSMSVLVGMSLLTANRGERWPRLRRAGTIALLSAALLAVMLLPMIDGYRNTLREAGPDLEQRSSQPILYALFNYVVSDSEWPRAGLLGMISGWNWFYIGGLPLLAALGLAPLVAGHSRWRRPIILSLAVLTLAILAWHANRHTPVRFIYDWIPFLYNLRFPNRLLILAASPLILLGGLGLQFLFVASRARSRGSVLTLSASWRKQRIVEVPLRWLPYGALILVMLFSVTDVYTVNKGFSFAPRPRNAKASEALSWLKAHDPGLYYTNIGGGTLYWDWTPAAYELEMPIINFDYGRRLTAFDAQRRPDSPFFATAKYMLALPDQPRPENAQLLRDFDGVGLWYLPDTLPFAFSAPPEQLQPPAKLASASVSPLNVSFDGPNRVIVEGAPGQTGERLVVLVSDYPGWRLTVDGQAVDMVPANGYLGAAMLPGEHTYTFAFQPVSHYAGLAISVLALLLTAAWIVHPRYRLGD